MTFAPAIICAVVGGVTAWAVIPVIQRCLQTFRRNEATQFHHTHSTVVSRLGGLALALAFVVVSLVIVIFFPQSGMDHETRPVIFVSAVAMFFLGFWDDLKPLGARRKLIGQILISSLACYGGIGIEKFQLPFSNHLYYLGAFGPVVTVVWLVSLTNLINLIDGIDGLAGGVALMLMGLLCYCGLGTSYPSLCAAGMMGALVGFLRFNFPPATIYMGDGGAYFLGFLIAAFSAVNSNKGTIMAALIAPLFVLALPIIDVSFAILRRGLKGLPVFRPDREHIHHRLISLGFSRTRAVLTLYAITVAFLILGLFAFWSQGRWVPIQLGIACIILLVAARTFNFSREWFSTGRAMGNSLQLRKSTQYALGLGRSLEMEAEWCDSVESLWHDFQFMTMKLGFSEVKLILEDGEREWKTENAENLPDLTDKPRFYRHDFNLNYRMALEFKAPFKVMDRQLFLHFCDISAEAWHKAVSSWQVRHNVPVRFKFCQPLETMHPLHQQRRANIRLWLASSVEPD